jgi:hypothetical protein
MQSSFRLTDVCDVCTICPDRSYNTWIGECRYTLGILVAGCNGEALQCLHAAAARLGFLFCLVLWVLDSSTVCTPAGLPLAYRRYES